MKSKTSPPRRKATLFCVKCGHESLIEGDWAITETVDRTLFECPDCGTTIESRTRFAAEVIC